MLRFSAHNM